MALLDCESGPGSITAGLATVVAPGDTVGIDIEPTVVERARENAISQGLSNLRFEVASIYELPFPDESFDAVFAHTVLQHLGEPKRALGEIHRVMKPGGVVGLRESDSGGLVFAPHSPILEDAVELYEKFWVSNGGDPYFARRHREVLRTAGFTGIIASASTDCDGNPKETQRRASHFSNAYRASGFVDRVIEQEWASRETLEKMSAAWKEWGEHPDAYWAIVMCEAVGWKAN